MSSSDQQAPGDSIILEEEIDPNYEPTAEETEEYARWLGMDLDTDRDLIWIAREGLKVRPLAVPGSTRVCCTLSVGVSVGNGASAGWARGAGLCVANVACGD